MANLDLSDDGLGYSPYSVFWADINGVRSQISSRYPPKMYFDGGGLQNTNEID